MLLPKLRSSTLFLSLVLLLITGKIFCQTNQPLSENDRLLSSLDQIQSLDIIDDDSIATIKRSDEESFLQSGDTLSAFKEYVHWMAYTLRSNRISIIGSGFDPYLTYANHHPSLKDHHLFQFFHGIHQSYQGSSFIAVQELLKTENEIVNRYPEITDHLYFTISNKLIELNDFEGAVDYAQKNLTAAQNTGNKMNELAARLLIATCFAKQNRIEEALRQREQAIDLVYETGEYGQLIMIFSNNAIDYRKLMDYNKSLEYYQNTYATLDTNTTYTEDNLRYMKAIVNLNKFTLWNDIKSQDSVLINYQPVIDSLQKYGIEIGIADGYVQVGRAYLMNEDYDQAIHYLSKADSLSQEKQFDEKRLDAVQYLAQSYKNISQYQNASEALSTWMNLKNQKDSLFNDQLVQTLQMRYESNRQLEIIDEKERIIAEQARIQKANIRIFFASAGSLGLVALSLLLWNHKQRLQHEKNIEILYNQKLIQYQETENQRVSKELHDGIGQNLTMIKNYIMMGDQEKSAQLLNDTLEEVRNISRHLHPFTLQKLGLTASVKNLLEELDHATPLLIDYSLDPVDARFDENSALNIFRIIQESLTNVIKHSHAKALFLEIKEHPNQCKIKIQDNGIGFDIQKNLNTINSLGLKTLKERTNLLKGQLSIDSSNEKGTQIFLAIPYDV